MRSLPRCGAGAKGTGDIDRLAAALAQALDGRFEDKRS
jgi:hypothetical protein